MPTPPAPPLSAALQQRIAAVAARRGAPGVQAVLVREGVPWFAHGAGLADAALGLPVTPRTTFNAYSIAKTVTATAVLALAESGQLDLDAPIGEAAGVGGLQAYGSVRDTLLHRAGFRNPLPLRWVHLAEAHTAFDEAGFVRAQVGRLRGTRRRWARSGYSNVGYLLLGLAIERAWGGPFVVAVQALVLDPLRLAPDERLGFAIDEPAQHARGHLRRHGLLDRVLGLFVERSSIVQHVGERWVQLQLHQVDGSAYGGLIANARGLARFGQAVLGTAAGVAPAVRQRLLEPVPGPGPARSLGWFSGTLRGHPWLAHAGGGLGAYGELRLYPGLDTVSALLTNGPGFSDARCLDGIDTVWLEA